MSGRISWVVAVVFAGFLALNAGAQDLEQIAERYRLDQQALHDYVWQSKVEVAVEGAVQSMKLYEMHFDDEGKLKRKVISHESGKISRDLQQAEQTLADVRQLIDAYAHMTPDNFSKVFGDQTRPGPVDEETGFNTVTAWNILRQGDEMKIWFDDDGRFRKVNINSALPEQTFQLVAEFADLPDGPTYVARSTFSTRRGKLLKQIVIVTENSDYRRAGN
jgi:hypothetical protein